MNFTEIKKIHFIGIGGVYASALALLMKKVDKEVDGCDLAESEFMAGLNKEGIDTYNNHSTDHIDSSFDLVVYSAAVPLDHSELQKAQELKINTATVYELLGMVTKEMFGIVVSGTKGKTTTTALIGSILIEASLDPTVLLGGQAQELTYGNLQVGHSEFLVMEGCEYKSQMLSLMPSILVLTNIEAEHLDYYKDLAHIIDVFKQYVAKIPKDGYLIVNSDDLNCHLVGTSSGGQIVTYGIDTESDVMAKNIRLENNQQIFDLYIDGRMVEEIVLAIPGKFNIYNALAAVAAVIHLEVDFKIIKKVLEKFQGSWRRFEKLGEYKGALVVSDYAHTPTSIKNVIQATKDFYPHRRIVAVFQPHLHSRTKKLFTDFTQSFGGSDLTIISDIYFVAGRVAAADQDVTSQQLVDAIKLVNSNEVLYGGNLDQTKELIINKIKPDDIVLMVGAGDIYKLAEQLVKQ